MYFWRFFSCHGMDQNAPYPWRFMRCVGCLAPSLSSFCLILILQYICERKTFLSKPKAICLEKVIIKCSICNPWIFGFDVIFQGHALTRFFLKKSMPLCTVSTRPVVFNIWLIFTHILRHVRIFRNNFQPFTASSPWCMNVYAAYFC